MKVKLKGGVYTEPTGKPVRIKTETYDRLRMICDACGVSLTEGAGIAIGYWIAKRGRELMEKSAAVRAGQAEKLSWKEWEGVDDNPDGSAPF